ncbi:hypothetical protein [Deefgea sp. CFH1-16]|uniref:hypothetical protein n=1 Tax=Deefgea sp. CFH1-16 TaxID=2675457 RepID=UPI0024940BA2|nr:hypothetical protein [Deefgea sp. CFH1-16]
MIGVKGQIKAEPMTLSNDKESYTLKFDCKPCEMHVMGKMKPHIFKIATTVDYSSADHYLSQSQT